MAAPSKREAILEAAARVVENVGAAHLTIDAVASAAAVSKGGVLYHFPSKQALIEGMLQRLLVQMTERTAAYRRAHDASGNADLVARIVAEHDQRPADRAMSRAILAAAAEDPALLAPARQSVREAFDEAAAGSDSPTMGWVLLLAVEGLRFLEMLDLLPLTKADRERLHGNLLDLARKHAR